jgi:hypothetical protein
LRQLLDGQNTMFDHFCSFVDIPRPSRYACHTVGPPVVFLGLLRFIFLEIGVRLPLFLQVVGPLSHDALHSLVARGYFATKCSAGCIVIGLYVYRIHLLLRHLATVENLRVIRGVFAGNSRVFAGYWRVFARNSRVFARNSRVFAGNSRDIRGFSRGLLSENPRRVRAASAPLRGVFAGRGPRRCATLV